MHWLIALKDATLDNYVTEFLESSNFFETGGFFKNIKDNNELLKSAIPKLSLAVDGIHKVTVRGKFICDLYAMYNYIYVSWTEGTFDKQTENWRIF